MTANTAHAPRRNALPAVLVAAVLGALAMLMIGLTTDPHADPVTPAVSGPVIPVFTPAPVPVRSAAEEEYLDALEVTAPGMWDIPDATDDGLVHIGHTACAAAASNGGSWAPSVGILTDGGVDPRDAGAFVFAAESYLCPVSR